MVALIILAVLGIGFVMWALCRACSIYDEWSEQREREEWEQYVYKEDDDDAEEENENRVDQ